MTKYECEDTPNVSEVEPVVCHLEEESVEKVTSTYKHPYDDA